MGEINPSAIFFQIVTESVFDGLLQIDLDGQIILWNKGAERITGYPAHKMVGHDFRAVFVRVLEESGEQLRENSSLISKTLADGIEREGLISFKHREGYCIKLLARTIAIQDETGEIIGAFEVINDNKALMSIHQQNKRTDETVLFDTLTGIGNRAHIESRIRQTLQFTRSSGISTGILFMDIDHFKEFNDTYGHLIGDKILRFVANALRQNLRTSDSCGRWGGEEFLALIGDTTPEGLRITAEKLRTLISQTHLEENGLHLHVTISVGAAWAREGDTLESLLQRADKMMYKSKARGRNCVTMDE